MRQRFADIVASGAIDLMVATAVAGGAGYILTLLAGIELGAARYVSFGVLWSSLFLVIGAINGVQQEVARATRPADGGHGLDTVRDVALGIAAFVFLVTMATSPLWVPFIFAAGGWWFAIPLALGLVGHTITTALMGMLHGVRQSRLIAGGMALDALMRLVLVVSVLGSTHDLVPISWAMTVPYVVMPVLLWLAGRTRVINTSVDVSRRRMLRNAGSTVLAATASGALISGISLLIAASARGVPVAHVGVILFSVNITRAPLIIAVSALQNYVVVRLRDRHDWRAVLMKLAAAVLVGTILFSAVVGVVGPAVFRSLLHGASVDPLLLALITASGGIVALMSLTGAAIIARGRHLANTTGWIIAAVATSVMLFTIPGFDRAVSIALIAGPLTGLIVHAVALAFERYLPVDHSPGSAPPEF